MKNRCQSFSWLIATRSWFASREIGKMIFFLHFLQLTCDSRKSLRLTHDSRKSSRLISRLTSHEICRSRVHPAAFATPLWLTRDLRKFSWLASHEMPRNSFLKGFSWETYFKPLPSSLKPLFQYFYIKTQSIWMFFHSIYTSTVILNSFHWFWSLDYVLESFCALGWDFHHRGLKNFFFVKFLNGIGFFWWFSLDVGPLWQKKKTCIKSGFHDVHTLFYIVVHSVHVKYLIKCLLDIFSLVKTPMSTKVWGLSCFLIRNMFGSLVVYLTHLAPHMHFSCFGHALHITTSCTHLCYPCHALVYTLFPHPSMSCLPYTL